MPSATDTLQLRPGTEADLPGVIDLLKASLGEGSIPRTREFFDWKHRANPFGNSPFHVAVAGARIVGVRLFMRWHWRDGRRSYEAVRAVDTATHPEFQGKGIFKRLTLGMLEELRSAGTAFVFNTPNGQSRPGYLKMGWQVAGRVSLWLKPVQPIKAAFALAKKTSATGDPDRSPGPTPPLVPAFEEAAAASILTPRVHGLATPRSTAYLQWRYAECRAASYYAATDDPRRALVVYRVRTRRGLRELSISELFLERSWRGVNAARRALLDAVGRTAPHYAVAGFRAGAWESAAFASAGFVPAPRSGPTLTLLPLQSAGAPRYASDFAATIGDFELF